ncbi:hypothetical protein ACHAWF_003361 [Thalassiosira exigua]
MGTGNRNRLLILGLSAPFALAGAAFFVARPSTTVWRSGVRRGGFKRKRDVSSLCWSPPPIAQWTLLHSVGSNERRGPHLQATPEKEGKFWTLPRLYVGPRNHGDGSENITPLLTSDVTIPLSPNQTHYLTNVMRILRKRKKRSTDHNDGFDARDCVRIFNGRDGEWLAKVAIAPGEEVEYPTGKYRSGRRSRSPKQGKDVSLVAQCLLQLRAQDRDVEPEDRPWMLFAPLKNQPRIKLLVEKCTELGVGRMVPVATDHMESGALSALLIGDSDVDALYGGCSRGNLKLEKLELQSIEAAEQSERLDVPTISGEVDWIQRETSSNGLWTVEDLVEKWCHNWKGRQHFDMDGNEETGDCKEDAGSTGSKQHNKRVLLICRERGSDNNNARVAPVLQALHDHKHIAFLVGPEGGWSTEEEEVFDKICARYGEGETPVRCVSLGSAVLRAETASMMAVGAWALMNDPPG